MTDTEFRTAYLNGALNEAEWWSRRLAEIVAEERAKALQEAETIAMRRAESWACLNAIRATDRRQARKAEAAEIAERLHAQAAQERQPRKPPTLLITTTVRDAAA